MFALRLTTLALLLAAGTPAFAQDGEDGPWALISMPRNETTAASLPLVTNGLDVEGGTPQTLHAEALPAAIAALQALGVEVTVKTPDIQSLRPAPRLTRGPGYHSAATVTEELRALAAARPEVARVVEIGLSVEGRPITGLLLTDEPGRREFDEPALRFVGTHHGDEWSAMEVSMAAAASLIDRYPEDPAVAMLLNHTEVWIVPVLNPDGVQDFRRRNANNVDLNRNYDYEGFIPGGAAGDAPFSEPETAAVRALSLTRSFHQGITLHSGAANIGWPWNWTTDAAIEEPLMIPIADAYAGRTTTAAFWTVQGGDWYLSFGDLNDWALDVQGTLDFTLECTEEKTPNDDEIPNFVDDHLDAVVAFLTESGTSGVRGRVVDESGNGVEAELLADTPSSATWADPESGAFARSVLGETELTVSAPGFVPQTVTVTGVPGPTDPWEWLSVTLLRDDPLTVDWIVPRELPSAGGELCVAGRDVLETVGLGGRLLLSRPFFDSIELNVDVTPECVLATVDPTDLGPPHRRQGEWTLLLEDAKGATRAHLPLAVLLGPSCPAHSVSAEPTDDPAVWRITLHGDALPEGALMRFSGPRGERMFPLTREHELDSPETLSATVAIEDWALGLWSVRLFGRGAWTALPEVLERDAIGLVVHELPSDDDDDDATDDDDAIDDDDATDDDDDSAEPTPRPPDEEADCSSCGASFVPAAAPILFLLPLVLRRRRRSC